MAFFPKSSVESPPMFETRFVDAFSRTHWSAVPLIYLPVVSLLVWYGVARGGISLSASAGLLLGGVFTWSFTEYWLHRTAFHWTPATSWGPRFHFFLHGVHHTWPRDRYRLVMPPAFSIAVFWIFLGIFSLLLGTWALPFHAGFTIGYVTYDLTHYYVHHHAPKWGLLKALRRHHLMHHAKKYENTKFGVSSPLWDHVFGTVGHATPKEANEAIVEANASTVAD
jgi:sterol desaturase/sphingolipid hydroxylase (fatty acid hydroxylase superfamily)